MPLKAQESEITTIETFEEATIDTWDLLGLYPEKIDKKETGHKWLPALWKVAKVAKQVASEGN